MNSIIATRTIQAPLTVVFQTVSDVRNFRKAVPHITDVEFLSEQQHGVGVDCVDGRRMTHPLPFIPPCSRLRTLTQIDVRCVRFDITVIPVRRLICDPGRTVSQRVSREFGSRDARLPSDWHTGCVVKQASNPLSLIHGDAAYVTFFEMGKHSGACARFSVDANWKRSRRRRI